MLEVIRRIVESTRVTSTGYVMRVAMTIVNCRLNALYASMVRYTRMHDNIESAGSTRADLRRSASSLLSVVAMNSRFDGP